MTDDEIERLADLIVAKLARRQLAAHRLSQQALEQRRAAGRASAAKRTKRKKRTARSTDPLTENSKPTTALSEVPLNGPVEKLSTVSPTPTTEVFLAYAAAYKLRYGAFPVRNAKVNGMLAQYVKRVPGDEAAPVAAFYVSSEVPLYVRASHCIDLLLRDAEAMRMAWATGRKDVQQVNGQHAARPWWESWSALVEQGKELGLEEGDNPTKFKFEVLRAAFVAGRLPEEIAIKEGVHRAGPDASST